MKQDWVREVYIPREPGDRSEADYTETQVSVITLMSPHSSDSLGCIIIL